MGVLTKKSMYPTLPCMQSLYSNTTLVGPSTQPAGGASAPSASTPGEGCSLQPAPCPLCHRRRGRPSHAVAYRQRRRIPCSRAGDGYDQPRCRRHRQRHRISLPRSPSTLPPRRVGFRARQAVWVAQRKTRRRREEEKMTRQKKNDLWVRRARLPPTPPCCHRAGDSSLPPPPSVSAATAGWPIPRPSHRPTPKERALPPPGKARRLFCCCGESGRRGFGWPAPPPRVSI